MTTALLAALALAAPITAAAAFVHIVRQSVRADGRRFRS